MSTQELDFPHTVTSDSDSYIVIAKPPTYYEDECPAITPGFESVAHAADAAMWDLLTEDWMELAA